MLEYIKDTYRQCSRIYNSELDWEEKYDLIFGVYKRSQVRFEWCDPDTTYEEDLHHFMLGFELYIDRLENAGLL